MTCSKQESIRDTRKEGHSDCVRTRFCPSPTGPGHLGNLRVAEYNYLFAKQKAGKFFLRFEDTDRKRSKDEYIESMRDSLLWLGLDFDNEIWKQSQRAEIYNEYLEKLISQDKVYFCQCESSNSDNNEEVESSKKKCGCVDRKLTTGVVRFKTPENKEICFEDMILGNISINTKTLEDFALRRTDGTFTYNFAVVVDDIEMKITHIFRGNDHVYNTFKQILLYEAFAAVLPVFGHIPLISDDEGNKFSKRLGTGDISTFRAGIGIVSDAMFNYLARLSGGYGDKELLSKNEAIENFDITKISKAAAKFDLDKLMSLSSHYLSQNPKKYFAELLIFLSEITGGVYTSLEHFVKINEVLEEFAKRNHTLRDLAASLLFIYKDLDINDEYLVQLDKNTLEELISLLTNVSDYDEENPENNIKNELYSISGHDWNENNIHHLIKNKFPDTQLANACNQLRISLLNRTSSPSIFLIIANLGKKDTLRKLKLALEKIEK